MTYDAVIVAGARTPMAVDHTHFRDLSETKLAICPSIALCRVRNAAGMHARR